nr:MAG TPA: hypothetical protein [Microviridae sp.]
MRKKTKKRKDRKIFNKTARSIERHNVANIVPRGGFRL